MGLLKGNQTQLGFLYPKTTDFIFSVIGEEMGFIVAGTIIILYVIFITKNNIYSQNSQRQCRNTNSIRNSRNFYIPHDRKNIGMVMGLLPITGVPLPFISYGGSSMITNYIMIGILLNISGKRQKQYLYNDVFGDGAKTHRPQNTLSRKHIKKEKKDVL